MSSITNYWEPGWRGVLTCGTVVVAMSNLEITPAIWRNMEKQAGFVIHSLRAVGNWDSGRWQRYASFGTKWSFSASGAMERRFCDPQFGPLYVSHIPVSCVEISNEFGPVSP